MDYERLSAAHAKLLAAAKAAMAQDDKPVPKKPVAKKSVLKKAPRSKAAEEEETAEESPVIQPRYEFRPRPRPRIEQLRFAEQDIYFLSGGDGIPFAPAWCLTPKELIVAVFPQQIKAYLSRGADFRSLATAPDVAALLQPGQAPVALSYFDGRKLLDYLYPMACMFLQATSGEFARDGIGLNVSIIPSAPAIYRHLRPGSTVVRRVEGGIEVISRGTIPGSSLGLAAPLAAVFSAARMAPPARARARRAVSMNNMRQISLAMLSYHETHDAFPPAYIADKKTGKPLLSWRVALLPFLERSDIYNRFHLDEPWDSEHNKKLSEIVIGLYRSPNSRTKGNMTNYLTVRGADTAFPGKDGIRLAQITDGTSNTIMVVEADDAKAVPWAKPDDLPYDEKQPRSGLFGLLPGGFNAAFCDGSVRFLSATIDAEMLRRLFNRNDGKPVDTSRF
jgi:prepilin-type processing-associated H-X9-DG protein